MLARALRLGLIVLALPFVAPMAALAQVSPQTLADVRAELDQLAADFNALKSELVASGNTASIGGGDALQRMDAIEAELAQLTMGPKAPEGLVALAAPLVAAILASLLWPAIGMRVFGLVVLGFAVWLARDDVARRFIPVSYTHLEPTRPY